MARAYSDEENEQWAEAQRLEEVRRAGMGLSPIRPGEGRPPRPRSRSQFVPPHLGGPPIEPPPRAASPGSWANPVVRQLVGAELGSLANPIVKTGNEPGSLGNPLVHEDPNRTVGQPITRRLPGKGLIEANSVPGAQAPMPVDQESVTKAATQGFANGFIGGLPQPRAQLNVPEAEAAKFADNPAMGLPAGSPLAALGAVAEAAEASTRPTTGLAARMARFPELKGVEVPTGNAARFPELEEEAPRPDTQLEDEQDGDFER